MQRFIHALSSIIPLISLGDYMTESSSFFQSDINLRGTNKFKETKLKHRTSID